MVWVVLVVLVALGLGWYFWGQNASVVTTPQTQTQGTTTPPTTPTTTQAPMSATVTYGPNGFSPSTVTIAKGGTVTFTAAAGADEMWIASDPHPTHQGYDGTTKSQHCAAGYSGPAPFDQCTTGTSFSFTFNQVGTWGYHNHGNSADRGTVVVQ